MNHQKLVNELIRDEGVKLKPYKCTAGHWTIGVGRTLEIQGISGREALYMLDNDIDTARWDLQDVFPDFPDFPIDAQHVLINLRHQLGRRGLAGFKRMQEAIRKMDWKEAAKELRDSKLWRTDAPARAERLAHRLECLED